MSPAPRPSDLLLLDDAVWLLHQPVGHPAYDFDFATAFPCRHPWERPELVVAVARTGAIADYDAAYAELAAEGIRLVNTPDEHRLASELPAWYPSLQGITPRSAWFDVPPSAGEVQDAVGWPAFVKGARQTSRHDPATCVARDGEDWRRLVDAWGADPILAWQTCVVRELVELRAVAARGAPNEMPPRFEFRTFWWKGELVGAGPYWSSVSRYGWTDDERDACLALAGEAARRVPVPFLVIDMAQTSAGTWIVIECNDGQESGYAGVSPHALWRSIADAVRDA